MPPPEGRTQLRPSPSLSSSSSSAPASSASAAPSASRAPSAAAAAATSSSSAAPQHTPWRPGPAGIKAQLEAKAAHRTSPTAALLALRAAGRADAAALTELGERLLDGCERDHVLPDPTQAVRCFVEAWRARFAPAAFDLASCFFSGAGATRDDAEGARLTLAAADCGLVEACFCAGGCYERGCGVSQSFEHAARYFRRATHAGDEEARDALRRCEAAIALQSRRELAEANRDYDAEAEAEAEAALTGAAHPSPVIHVGVSVPAAAPSTQSVESEADAADARFAVTMLSDLRAIADRGDVVAMMALARRLVNSTGGIKRADLPQAARYWRRAAEAGHAPAQLALGERLLHGGPASAGAIAGDYEGAMLMLNRAAQQGDVRALYLLGLGHEHGDCIPPTSPVGHEHGDSLPPPKPAPLVMRSLHSQAVAPGAKASSATMLQAAAAPVPAPSSSSVRRDVPAAMALYRIAADLGHSQARIALRRLERAQRRNMWAVRGLEAQRAAIHAAHARGAESFASLKLGAEVGDAAMQFALATRLRAASAGKSVAERVAVLHEAAKLYRHAAEQGLAAAQEALADLLFDGASGPRDVAEAALLYRAAADQGAASAQQSLAAILESGEGLPAPDPARARQLYTLAAAQGDTMAREALERIERAEARLRSPTFSLRAPLEEQELKAARATAAQMRAAPLARGLPAVRDEEDDALVAAVWPLLTSGAAASTLEPAGPAADVGDVPAAELYRRPDHFL